MHDRAEHAAKAVSDLNKSNVAHSRYEKEWADMKKFLLLDGHSLAYRAFYALPVDRFATSTGQPTNAIYGFCSMLVNLLAEQKPDQVIVAFDHSRKTFRTERFPEYKANRAKSPDEFRSQIDYIIEMIDGFNIPIVIREGYEADDLIATLSRAVTAESDDNRVFITTGDRDSFQLIDDHVTVLYPMKGVTELASMTPSSVEAKYGLTPSQYPDFAALRGDPSDNLPSIPGVGEKTAIKWIQEYGSLSGLIAKADQVPGKVGEALRAHTSQVLLNRELTHLVDDVPIDASTLSSLVMGKWEGVDLGRTRSLFAKLEIKALKERIEKLPISADSLDDAKSDPSTPAKAPSNEVKVIKSNLEKALADISGEFALVVERKMESGELEVALSPRPGLVHSFYVGALTGESLKDCAFFGHGVKSWLREIEFSDSTTVLFDSELAGYLLNPGVRDLSLETLVQEHLGIERSIPSDDQDLFTSPTFAPELASDLWSLRELLTKQLQDQGVSELLAELEIPLTLSLAKMERLGIGFDAAKAKEIQRGFSNELATEIGKAHECAGHEFNVNSPKQLQVVLFEELKLPKTKRIKSGYSTDADSLMWLHQETNHPLLGSLLRIREVGKLETVLEGLITSAKVGRIHTIFQQTVTATGRLSSTDPNLQNIPVRSEEGRRIRDCFIAQKPYSQLLTADYSQIEMRIMAHLSADKHLIEAFNSGEDLHNSVAGLVFGVKPDQVSSEMRRTIKAMSYGLAYGLSAFGLAQQLDLSPSEAQKLMDDYFTRFGGIRDYLQSVVRTARERGFTETLLGRRRYLPDLTSENRQRREMAERMALNAPIQGSAADIIKSAMLIVEDGIEKAGLQSRMILQVHDELIFEVMAGEEMELEKLVRDGMSKAYPLDLPLEVSVGIGASWDEAAH